LHNVRSEILKSVVWMTEHRLYSSQCGDFICGSMCYMNEWPKRFLKTFIQQYSDYQVRQI